MRSLECHSHYPFDISLGIGKNGGLDRGRCEAQHLLAAGNECFGTRSFARR